jgi:spore coat polysaccharide biosynthesis protein SpsF
MKFKTEQENFWAGDFGTEYIDRNKSNHLLASNLNFFSKALGSAKSLETCIEFGANIGMNLKALKLLYPMQQQYGIEINENAALELSQLIGPKNIFNNSILDFSSEQSWDLTLIKGVLIHINPADLYLVYKKLVRACGKYLLIAEYYNTAPTAIIYRGHENRLFKRDFAGEILDQYPEMELVDYGFVYRRDPAFPQDDITWFLLRKRC